MRDMRDMHPALCPALLLVATISIPLGGGCEEATSSADATDTAIVGGSKATSYPEAVLVNVNFHGVEVADCSGVLVAPRVVLTAGHCVKTTLRTPSGVDVPDSWTITAPYVDLRAIVSTKALAYDWQLGDDANNLDHHDVALVVLPKPIALGAYPPLARQPLPDSTTNVVNIGRIDNGTISESDLFVGPSILVQHAFQHAYVTTLVVQHGDSGGPVEVVGSQHLVVAVNSNVGPNYQWLARIDEQPIADWIQSVIAANGGGGAAASSAGTPPDAGTSADAG
jgi:hypothetical protein